MHAVRTWLRVAPALVVTAACGSEPHGGAGERLTLVAEVRIGDETRPEYQLSVISQVVAHGGAIYLAQRGGEEIRVFGTDGTARPAIGRLGAGPGEFQALEAIGFLGDSLWTIDNDLRRISFFDASGALLATVPFEPVPDAIGTGVMIFFPYPKAVAPNGGLLGFGGTSGTLVADGKVTAQPLLHMSRAGRDVDTLGWASVKNDDLILRSERSMSFHPQPFTDAPLTVYAPLAQRVFVVERPSAVEGTPSNVRITALATTGDTAWSVRVPYAPSPLDPSIVDSVRSRLTKGLAGRYPPDEVDRKLYAPAFRTPITDAIAGDDGTLWLRWDDVTSAGRYTVLDRDGRVRSEVNASSRTQVKWANGDVVWGVELDENDVPTVVRYRVSSSKP